MPNDTKKPLLRQLTSQNNNAGHIAALRLATLALKPSPELRITFTKENQQYRRLKTPGVPSAGGTAMIEGEGIHLALLEPVRSRNRAINHRVSFESTFPMVYEAGFRPASIRDYDLVMLLRDYLQDEISSSARQTLHDVNVPLLQRALGLTH